MDSSISPFTGQTFVIDPSVTEPLVIDNFDLTQDVISLPGVAVAYTVETVDGNLQISSAEGTLLAILTGVTELSPYQGFNPEGTSYLISLENEFFDTYIEPYFFEPIYPIQNIDVDALIAAGEYTSYYDHFIKAGQFETREDTFLAGTESNDTLYSLGWETVLVGVPITQAQYQGGIDVVATDMGMGSVDTLYGGAGIEAIFVLGTSNIFNETAQSFYIGGGNEDYALIKDFTPGDRIFLGSDAAGFTQEVVDGSTQISKDGDLIAIVEGLTELAVREDDNKELVSADEIAALYAQGTDGDDVIYPSGRQNSVIGVSITETEAGQSVATSTGVGEFDIFYDNSEVAPQFFLGFPTVDSPDAPQTLYLGNGDEDYALIKDFDPFIDRFVYLAGKFDAYEFEVVDGDTRISKDGDLIGVAEDVTLIPEFEIGGYTNVISSQNVALDDSLGPVFNETLYLENNPDVKAAVEAGEYESGLQQFRNVGLLEDRYAFYTGTDGNDEGFGLGIWGVGNSYIIGVPATGFNPETEQFTTESTGTGTIDKLSGLALTNKFMLGNNGQSFYVGNGDEDYAVIGVDGYGDFDPAKDFIFLAGAYEDYSFETITDEEGNETLKIAKDGDLVASVNFLDDAAPELELYTGDSPEGGFYLVGGEAEPEPISPFTGQIYEIPIDLTEPRVIENFDITKDSIQLSANPDSEVIPQFSFSDRYALTEINSDTVISTLAGQLLAVIKDVTGLETFTGYTEKGTYSLVSLENEFFSTQVEANFFEPWYLEFDRSDYGNSVQEAIDAGLVTNAYEHYLKFGQFEAREDSLFAPTTDGNSTIYGSGYEGGLVGVPISEGVYTRDVKPVTTGVGEIDTFIGAPGEDTFFLGNAAILNETSQPFYVGEGDNDYVLIKNFDQGSTFGQLLSESAFAEFFPGVPPSAREALTDRILLAGKPYDYEFEKIGDDLKISFQDDLIALIEDAPPIDVTFTIPGATYVYTTGNVATFDQYSGFGTENTLYEPFYFEENPGVEEAIANGEYKSAFEHYVKVGQFNPEGEVIFSGSSGDDFLVGFGNSSLLSGVEVTFVDGETEGYRTESTGVGEADFVVGGLGIDTFFIGNDNILDPEKGGEVWYVGNGDEDYLTIQGFDPYKDFLFGAGSFEDYSFEVIDEVDDIFGRLVPYQSLEVSYQGDRVAVLAQIDGSLTLPDLTSLISFPLGEERPNGLALVAPQNEFLPEEPPAGSEFFNEALYLATFPNVADLVASGEYESGLDYYIQVGQFEGENLTEGFFTGTSGNDTVTGFGADSDLYGVGFDSIVRAEDGTVTLTPNSLGVGEIDILQANADGFTGAYLTAYSSFNFDTFTADTVPLYVGNGSSDYALIKDLDPSNGYVAISTADFSEYEFKVDEEGFKIYYEDDLIGIAEGVYDLQVGFYEPSIELAALSKTSPSGAATGGFDEDLYLQFTPDAAKAVEDGTFASGLDYYVAVGQYALNDEGEPASEGFFTGTSGNNTIIGFGQATGLSGVGMKARTDLDPFAIEFESTGAGEVDVLIGNEGENGFLLGSFVTPASPEQFVFYQGNGDEDYALIRNFNPGEVGGDELEMVGNPDDYTFENVDGNVEISYKGDLVAIVENISDLIVTSTFVDGEASYFTVGKYPVEQFNAEVYAAFNSDIFEFIGEGKPYKDVLDYYVQEGQFREDGGGHGFFSGTSGDDVLQGFGFDKDLFGVAYTSVTGSVPDEIVLVPETLGVGEIDTMTGSPGVDGFYAAAFTSVDFNNFVGDAAPLYIGQGDEDYVLIKGFDPAKDYFALAGAPAGSIYKVEQGDFKVYSQEGDLVAIVEDNTDLKVENIFDTFNLFTFEGDDSGQGLGFDEEAYLGIYPEVAQLVADGQYSSALEHYIEVGQYEEGGSIYSGTSGNDTLISWTQNAEVRLSGVDFVSAEPAGFEEGQNYFGIKPATYGVGEIDTLILSPDEGTIGEALLGYFRGADGSLQRFYVGQGDEDYALVKNFNKNDLDEVFLAGAPDDYTYEDVDGNLHIAYQGDLVGIVEGVKYEELELADEGEGSDAFVLIGKPENTEPSDGDDLLDGSSENDTIAGELGNDDISGGDGNDILRGDQNSRDAQTDLPGGDDTILGGSGDDHIGGKFGNDMLSGDEGNDSIWGDAGDDLIRGGLGDDRIWGGTGTVGGDMDTFILAVGEGTDTIIDFEVGLDKIGLADGLMADALIVEQSGNRTQISAGDETLAFLRGVDAAALLASDPFVAI